MVKDSIDNVILRHTFRERNHVSRRKHVSDLLIPDPHLEVREDLFQRYRETAEAEHLVVHMVCRVVLCHVKLLRKSLERE